MVRVSGMELLQAENHNLHTASPVGSATVKGLSLYRGRRGAGRVVGYCGTHSGQVCCGGKHDQGLCRCHRKRRDVSVLRESRRQNGTWVLGRRGHGIRYKPHTVCKRLRVH